MIMAAAEKLPAILTLQYPLASHVCSFLPVWDKWMAGIACRGPWLLLVREAQRDLAFSGQNIQEVVEFSVTDPDYIRNLLVRQDFINGDFCSFPRIEFGQFSVLGNQKRPGGPTLIYEAALVNEPNNNITEEVGIMLFWDVVRGRSWGSLRFPPSIVDQGNFRLSIDEEGRVEVKIIVMDNGSDGILGKIWTGTLDSENNSKIVSEDDFEDLLLELDKQKITYWFLQNPKELTQMDMTISPDGCKHFAGCNAAKQEGEGWQPGALIIDLKTGENISSLHKMPFKFEGRLPTDNAGVATKPLLGQTQITWSPCGLYLLWGGILASEWAGSKTSERFLAIYSILGGNLVRTLTLDSVYKVEDHHLGTTRQLDDKIEFLHEFAGEQGAEGLFTWRRGYAQWCAWQTRRQADGMAPPPLASSSSFADLLDTSICPDRHPVGPDWMQWEDVRTSPRGELVAAIERPGAALSVDDRDRVLALYDTVSMRCLVRITFDHQVQEVAFAPDPLVPASAEPEKQLPLVVVKGCASSSTGGTTYQTWRLARAPPRKTATEGTPSLPSSSGQQQKKQKHK